jgi:hypothetical protein
MIGRRRWHSPGRVLKPRQQSVPETYPTSDEQKHAGLKRAATAKKLGYRWSKQASTQRPVLAEIGHSPLPFLTGAGEVFHRLVEQWEWNRKR